MTGVASVDFVATINVYANSQENAGEFVLNGNVKATVSALGVTYEGTANLTGKAVYDATKDEAVVGLNGTINFQKLKTKTTNNQTLKTKVRLDASRAFVISELFYFQFQTDRLSVLFVFFVKKFADFFFAE